MGAGLAILKNYLNQILVLLLALFLVSNYLINISISTYYPSDNWRVAEPQCGTNVLIDDSFVSEGWWPGEDWGRWSRDGISNVFFKAPASKFNLNFSIQKVSDKTEYFFIGSNDNIVNNSNPNQIKLTFNSFEKGQLVELEFETKNAVPPFLVDSNNADFRKLGAGVSQLYFDCPDHPTISESP